MVTATGDRHLQPGMVSVIQTSGDLLQWNPHLHVLLRRAARSLGPSSLTSTIS